MKTSILAALLLLLLAVTAQGWQRVHRPNGFIHRDCLSWTSTRPRPSDSALHHTRLTFVMHREARGAKTMTPWCTQHATKSWNLTVLQKGHEPTECDGRYPMSMALVNDLRHTLRPDWALLTLNNCMRDYNHATNGGMTYYTRHAQRFDPTKMSTIETLQHYNTLMYLESQGYTTNFWCLVKTPSGHYRELNIDRWDDIFKCHPGVPLSWAFSGSVTNQRPQWDAVSRHLHSSLVEKDPQGWWLRGSKAHSDIHDFTEQYRILNGSVRTIEQHWRTDIDATPLLIPEELKDTQEYKDYIASGGYHDKLCCHLRKGSVHRYIQLAAHDDIVEHLRAEPDSEVSEDDSLLKSEKTIDFATKRTELPPLTPTLMKCDFGKEGSGAIAYPKVSGVITYAKAYPPDHEVIQNDLDTKKPTPRCKLAVNKDGTNHAELVTKLADEAKDIAQRLQKPAERDWVKVYAGVNQGEVTPHKDLPAADATDGFVKETKESAGDPEDDVEDAAYAGLVRMDGLWDVWWNPTTRQFINGAALPPHQGRALFLKEQRALRERESHYKQFNDLMFDMWPLRKKHE